LEAAYRGVLQDISQAPRWEVGPTGLCPVLVPLVLHKILCGHCLWHWDETAQLLVGEFNIFIYAFREIFYMLCVTSNRVFFLSFGN
jgi:hypothetical protein